MSDLSISVDRLTGVRKAIAERMSASLATAAQLSYHVDADVTELMRLRTAWKQQGVRISLEDCILAVFARTLAGFPELNGVLDGDQIARDRHVHVAVAISVAGSLMTPVIRNADLLSLTGLAGARAELVTRARANKLKVSEMKGGTVTLSNLGLTAVRYFTPILNSGQLLLLGLGRLESRLARASDGSIVDREYIGLSLTADHRVVDGEPAGRFLAALSRALEAFDVEP